MKINSKVLSVPPYLSTSWENVISLQLDEASGRLVVFLKNNAAVSIPNLSSDEMEEIFMFHNEHIESVNKKQNAAPKPNLSFGLSTTSSEDLFNPLMTHDPLLKNSPDLPSDVMNKIVNVTKALGVDTKALNLPNDEPHCNCPYCQISRAMKGKVNENKIPDIDNSLNVTDDVESDLNFREWDIKEIENHLFEVTNPNDQSEQYQVFLAHPIGCTCGKANCEHIRAVLKS
jgi:hypothetical protein